MSLPPAPGDPAPTSKSPGGSGDPGWEVAYEDLPLQVTDLCSSRSRQGEYDVFVDTGELARDNRLSRLRLSCPDGTGPAFRTVAGGKLSSPQQAGLSPDQCLAAIRQRPAPSPLRLKDGMSVCTATRHGVAEIVVDVASKDDVTLTITYWTPV